MKSGGKNKAHFPECVWRENNQILRYYCNVKSVKPVKGSFLSEFLVVHQTEAKTPQAHESHVTIQTTFHIN